MNKYVSIAILVCAFAVISPQIALGQWDYGQNILDNLVEYHAARRRTEGRSKGSKSGHGTTAAKRKGAARNTGASAAKPAAPTYPRYGIVFTRDSYQDFHREDINGFKVNFTFTSAATGKTISKFDYAKLYGIESLIEGIPAGVYTVRATAVYDGKTYPAHIGTQEGSDDNLRGGDFAASIQIQIKPEINEYGQHVMNVSPERLYVRVIE